MKTIDLIAAVRRQADQLQETIEHTVSALETHDVHALSAAEVLMELARADEQLGAMGDRLGLYAPPSPDPAAENRQ